MGHTLIEKVIMKNTGLNNVEAGSIVIVKPDKLMVHDIFVPFVVQKFEEMGFKKIYNPDKMVLVYDHLVPTANIEDVRHFKIAEEFCEKYGIKNIHRSDGICHQLMVECCYVKPGNIVFGTDSHTTTYGAIGAFSTGIGYTEMAAVLGTGEIWIKVPQTIRINIDGKLPIGVTSKDVILRIIGDLKSDGATYKSLEFSGTTVKNMTIDSRMTMANMAIESGAKAGLFVPDVKIAEYCNVDVKDLEYFKPDRDAKYESVLNYKAEDFVPVVAYPSQVDNIKTVKEVSGTKIDQVFIGSCTNGRLEDLEIAAEILRGKKIAKYLKLIVTPASRKIYDEAIKSGIIKILAEAGAMITHPGCGLCCGRSGGIVCEGEKVLATNNRNFLGRMGSSKAEIYLCSPAVAAISALTGQITNP